jgi:hypothetical protein
VLVSHRLRRVLPDKVLMIILAGGPMAGHQKNPLYGFGVPRTALRSKNAIHRGYRKRSSVLSEGPKDGGKERALGSSAGDENSSQFTSSPAMPSDNLC